MKQLKKWALRLTATGLLIAVLLIGIVLNPSTLYANRTDLGAVTIYHNTTLDNALKIRLTEANALLKDSELYDANFKLSICLNDGSAYPSLIQKWQGDAFAWGFYNKVVLNGIPNYSGNYVELKGYHWNLSALIAHEATHCMQFNKFGLWKSNPVAGYPTWKWEGYPEYVARKTSNPNLAESIKIYTKSDANEWGVTLADNTSVSREYYKYWLLVSYCLDVKHMTYEQLLQDTMSEKMVMKELMEWPN